MTDIISGLGPAGYLTLAMGIVAVGTSLVVPFVIGVWGRALPATLAWAPTVACVFAGMFAVMSGTGRVLRLASGGSEGTVGLEIALGTRAVMGEMVLMSGLAGCALIVFALVLSMPTALFTGEESYFQWRTALGAVAGGSLGLIATVVGLSVFVGVGRLGEGSPAVYGVPVLAMILAGASVLCSLRESPVHGEQGRIAGARFAVCAAAALGLLMWGECLRYAELRVALQAVTTVGLDGGTELWQGALGIAPIGPYVAWCCAAIPLGAGFGGALRGLRRLESIQMVGGGLALVQMVLIFAAFGFAGGRLGRNLDLMMAVQ
jgi:hypothetical protein